MLAETCHDERTRTWGEHCFATSTARSDLTDREEFDVRAQHIDLVHVRGRVADAEQGERRGDETRTYGLFALRDCVELGLCEVGDAQIYVCQPY